MFNNLNDPRIVKIIFDQNNFICNDLYLPGRIHPQALPKIESLLNDLNELAKKSSLNFPYYTIIFLFLYIISFVAIMITKIYYLLFIPIIFFLLFFVGIIWHSISMNKFVQNMNKTVDSYRREIDSYYIIFNTIRLYRRKYEYSYDPGAIYFLPSEDYHIFAGGYPYSPNFTGTQMNRINGNTYPTNNIVPIQNNNSNSLHMYQQIPHVTQQPNNINSNNNSENIPVYTYDPDATVKYDNNNVQDKDYTQKDKSI